MWGSPPRVWATALAYVTNRAIQQRLDDVVGPENWKNEFREWHGGSTLCGIGIRVREKAGCESCGLLPAEWVTKWDGADDTHMEATKGGLSDSMKRAAVQWGIGRYLYRLDAAFLPPECISDVKQQGFRRATDKKSNTVFWWTPPALPAWALP